MNSHENNNNNITETDSSLDSSKYNQEEFVFSDNKASIDKPYKVVKADEQADIVLQRSYKVVKANEIIQKARNDLNITELKAMSFIFSKIKPTDIELKEYTFSIKEYCLVVGIDERNGGNYATVKRTLKNLRDKSFWLMDEHGVESTVGWLSKAKISRGSGNVKVRLDEDIQKYVIGLYEGQYTQYELLCCLPMKSSYSYKMYELLKSYAFQKKHTFEIESLKRLLSAEHYSNFKDFRKRVLSVGIEEINLYTDLEVTWEPILKGKRIIQITFFMKQRDSWGRIESEARATNEIEKKKNKKNSIEGQLEIKGIQETPNEMWEEI